MAEVQNEDAKAAKFSCIFKCGKEEACVKLFDDHVCIDEAYTRNILFQDILKTEVEGKEETGFQVNLIFVVRKDPKENLLSKEELCLTGSKTDCTVLHGKLQQAVNQVPGRPRNLLVLINPNSGGCTCEKIYRNQVAPLFELAGIKTVIRVTERNGHMVGLIQAENLTLYDGLVVLGGDGTFHECINGLIPVIQKEAGINADDSTCDLAQVPIPVGLIPAGSGNGVAAMVTGTNVETCALSIIRGNRSPMNVSTFHSSGKLLAISCLLAAHGYFSDLMQTTERLRWMGRARYFVFALTTMFTKSRIFEAEVDYLPVEYEKDPGFKFELETQEGEKPGWKKVQGQFTGIYFYNLLEYTDDSKDYNSIRSVNGVSLFLENSQDRFSHYRLMKKIATQDLDFGTLPSVSKVNVKEFKVKFGYEYSEEDKNQEKNQFPPLEQTLQVDGEIYTLQTPTFSMKFHKKILQTFVLDNT